MIWIIWELSQTSKFSQYFLLLVLFLALPPFWSMLLDIFSVLVPILSWKTKAIISGRLVKTYHWLPVCGWGEWAPCPVRMAFGFTSLSSEVYFLGLFPWRALLLDVPRLTLSVKSCFFPPVLNHHSLWFFSSSCVWSRRWNLLFCR